MCPIRIQQKTATEESRITASTTIPLRQRHSTGRVWPYWVPPFVWIVLNFIASGDLLSGGHTAMMLRWVLGVLHLHVANVELLNHILRKIGHFAAYAILGGLFFRSWRASLPEFRRAWRDDPATGNPVPTFRAKLWTLRWAALAVSSAALAAIFDEWHQSFVPTRGSSLWDVLLDTGGAIFLQLILMMLWINKDVASRE